MHKLLEHIVFKLEAFQLGVEAYDNENDANKTSGREYCEIENFDSRFGDVLDSAVGIVPLYSNCKR